MTKTMKKYDTLDSYLSLAKKTISKFGPSFYNSLAREMLNSTEAVSDIATAIMYADWRFDSERSGRQGLKKTIYSYRNQCAIWAIKTYISNKYKNKKNILSIDFENDSNSTGLTGTIQDKKASCPIDILILEESADMLSSDIASLLDNNLISEKQKEQIKLYYFEDETLSSIGLKFGVSREAVRQNIKRAMDIIKKNDLYNQ